MMSAFSFQYPDKHDPLQLYIYVNILTLQKFLGNYVFLLDMKKTLQ